MAENDAAAAALGGMDGVDASQLAAMVGQVPDEQVAEGMANPVGRRMILDEIFRRMSEHAEPSKIEGVDAVVHFEITDAPEGGSDVYEAVIRNGKIEVSDEPSEQPKGQDHDGPGVVPEAGHRPAVGAVMNSTCVEQGPFTVPSFTGDFPQLHRAP